MRKTKSLKRRKIEAIAKLILTIILILASIKAVFWWVEAATKENAKPIPSYMLEIWN